MAVEMRHRKLPLLLLATIRTEDLAERPRLAAQLEALSRYVGESVERVYLERLGREVSYQLVEAIFPCDDQLTGIIYERSAGNPLHLMLLLRYLREEDLLESDGQQWHARNLSRVRAAMPPSLADLFHVRVQQVEERLQTAGNLSALLVRAAVIGPRFSYGVLERMIELEADAERFADFDIQFDRLLAEGLIVEVEGRGEDWYQFNHALLRDYFLREKLGPGLFKKLHRLAAEAMVDALGARVDQYALEIAAHWRSGGRTERALEWYRRGANSLRASSMFRQAAAAYEVCVELMDARLAIDSRGESSLPSVSDAERFERAGVTLSEYVDTLVRLGDLLEGFSEFDRAEKAYRRVVRMVAGDHEGLADDVLRALGLSWKGLGHIAWQRGDFEAAEWAFQKVRQLVEGREALRPVAESAARGLSWVFWHRGEYARASELTDAALASATARGDIAGEAASHWLLGEVDRMKGEGELAREHYETSLELYRQSDDPTGVARNLLSMAQLARYQKAFGEAQTLYQRALSRYETLGDRRGAGQCYNGLGDIARFEERYRDARRNYARALDIYEAIGAGYDVALVYTNLGLTAIALSDYEAADEYLSAAGNMVTGDEYPYLLAGVEFNLALVKSLRGDDAESEAILDDVLELAERFPIPDLDYAQPLERLGRLRAEAGDTREAVELWEKAAEIYRELELGEDLERVQGYIAGEG
jgi:tetratricopeptide (TPR) repeat protein